MALGPELIVNGGFDTTTPDPDQDDILVPDNWVNNGNSNGRWLWVNGVMTYDGNSNDNSISNDYGTLYQETNFDPIPTEDPVGKLEHNEIYQVSFTIGGGNALADRFLYVALGEVLSFDATRFVFPIVDGRVTFYAVAHSNLVGGPGIGVQGIFFYCYHTDVTVTLDDISVRKVISGLLTGPELVVNGAFRNNADDWTLDANWAFDTDKLTKTAGAGRTFSQELGLEEDKFYLITIDATGNTPDLIRDQVIILGDDDFYSDDVDPRQPQVAQFIVQTTHDGSIFFLPLSSGLLTVSTSSDFVGSIDNVSVREILGFDNNLYLQNVFLVGSSPEGDVQTINAGKADDGDPIYYELETQNLKLGSQFHKKKITDKLVVFSKEASDSKLQIKQDKKDYDDISATLSKPVSVTKMLNVDANEVSLKWSGQATVKSPILEGFHIEKVIDEGIS